MPKIRVKRGFGAHRFNFMPKTYVAYNDPHHKITLTWTIFKCYDILDKISVDPVT